MLWNNLFAGTEAVDKEVSGVWLENYRPNWIGQTLLPGNIKGVSTIDPLFDCFGISCMTTDNCCFYLQNRLIQTSQTGGQRYSDTSPISIPCSSLFWWRRKKSFVASTLSNWMIKVFSQTSRGQKNEIFPLHRLWTWRTWRMWRA
jgi:hypothetical protein